MEITWCVSGEVLSVVVSGHSCVRFCQCFGRDFDKSVRPLSWVCCTLGFGFHVGWFLMGWVPSGVFRVGFCRSWFQIVWQTGEFAK